MSSATAFPPKMTLRKVVIVDKLVSDILRKSNLLEIVATTAGARMVGEEMLDVPSRAGVLVEAAAAVGDLCFPQPALHSQGFDLGR